MSNFDDIKNNIKWENTPLINFLNLFDKSFRNFNIGVPKDISDIKRTFAIGGGEEVNSSFKSKIVLNTNYEQLNSILSLPTVIPNEKAFSSGCFKIKYLNNLNYNNIYSYVDEEYLYLIFLNKDLSQLFIVLANRREIPPRVHYEYVDIDDAHIDVYSITDYPDSYVFDDELGIFIVKNYYQEKAFIESIEEGSDVIKTYDKLLDIWQIKYNKCSSPSRRIVSINYKYYFFRYGTIDWYAGYISLEDEFFFENLQKFLKIKNIKNLQDISDEDFWNFCEMFLSRCYTTSSSGVKRILKYKIIIINSMLGLPRLNEKFFSLNQLHFNRVKNNYYFTSKLDLSKILEFSFITKGERDYIENMKSSIEGSITMSWTRKEVNLLFDTSSNGNGVRVLFGSIEEAIKLVKNKNENQIKDKFKSLYKHYYWRASLYIPIEERLDDILNNEMGRYRKIIKSDKK